MNVKKTEPKGPTTYQQITRLEKPDWPPRRLITSLLNAHSDQLRLLADLFDCRTSLVAQMGFLRQLVERRAGMKLIEAGVRGIYLSKHKVDFSKLSLNDLSHASLVVFHPEAPLNLLNLCFIKAFRKTLEVKGWEEAAFWKGLAKAALFTLIDAAIIKKNPEAQQFLRDNNEAIKLDQKRTLLMSELVEWMRDKIGKDEPPIIEVKEAEGDLNKIENSDIAKAYDTAVKFLTRYGLIKISARLD